MLNFFTMLKEKNYIETPSGLPYTTIYSQEEDIKYSDLVKYIPQVHYNSEYKDYSQYNQYNIKHYNHRDIIIQNNRKLLYNGIPINLYDNIDFNKVLTITSGCNYYHTDKFNNLKLLDSTLQNPLSIIFVNNQT